MHIFFSSHKSTEQYWLIARQSLASLLWGLCTEDWPRTSPCWEINISVVSITRAWNSLLPGEKSLLESEHWWKAWSTCTACVPASHLDVVAGRDRSSLKKETWEDTLRRVLELKLMYITWAKWRWLGKTAQRAPLHWVEGRPDQILSAKLILDQSAAPSLYLATNF